MEFPLADTLELQPEQRRVEMGGRRGGLRQTTIIAKFKPVAAPHLANRRGQNPAANSSPLMSTNRATKNDTEDNTDSNEQAPTLLRCPATREWAAPSEPGASPQLIDPFYPASVVPGITGAFKRFFGGGRGRAANSPPHCELQILLDHHAATRLWRGRDQASAAEHGRALLLKVANVLLAERVNTTADLDAMLLPTAQGGSIGLNTSSASAVSLGVFEIGVRQATRLAGRLDENAPTAIFVLVGDR